MSRRSCSDSISERPSPSICGAVEGPPRSTRHLPWIDVARGIAAFWVALFHSRATLWVGYREIQNHPEAYSAMDRWLAMLSFPAALGGSGVMLFFLVSGFCVHLPEAGKTRPLNVRAYALRRTLRIGVPYLAIVFLTWGIEWGASVLGAGEPTDGTRMVRVISMTQNYGEHAGQPMSNPSLWSLPVEMELYAAYFVFGWMVRRWGPRGALLGSGLVSLAATVCWLAGATWPGGNFMHYWLIWCGGALLAEWWVHGDVPRFSPWNAWIALLSLIVAAISSLGHWPYAIQNYLWAAGYFHVLWLALRFPRMPQGVIGGMVRAVGWLGKISYSLYLVHYPLFFLWGACWVKWAGSKPASFLVPLAATLAVIPIAGLFWRLLEAPSHTLARRWAGASEASRG